jgi:hypothetical protein
MARIQILELPEGASDERPPLVLVIDQTSAAESEGIAARFATPAAERLGARAILAFPGTIDIPANQIPVGSDGLPLRVRVEGDFDAFRQQVQDEATVASSTLTSARYSAERYRDQPPRPYDEGGYSPTEMARSRDEWMKAATDAQDRLERERENRDSRKAALTDALGMDRLRDWDDIVNAARGLRKDRDAQRDQLQRASEYDTALSRVRSLPDQPEVMDAQHPNPDAYLHGYKAAIRDAKRAARVPLTTEQKTGNGRG